MSREWDGLWDAHSRLLDRMIDVAQKEFIGVDKNTVRVCLTVGMLFDLLLGRALRFKTGKADIVLARKWTK